MNLEKLLGRLGTELVTKSDLYKTALCRHCRQYIILLTRHSEALTQIYIAEQKHSQVSPWLEMT